MHLFCSYRNFAVDVNFVLAQEAEQKRPEVQSAEPVAGKVEFTEAEAGVITVDKGRKAVEKVARQETPEQSDFRKALFTQSYLDQTGRDPIRFVEAMQKVDSSIPPFDFASDNTHLVGAVEHVQAKINEERKKSGQPAIREDGAWGAISEAALKQAFPEAHAIFIQQKPEVEKTFILDPTFVYEVQQDNGPFKKGELVYLRKVGGELKAVNTERREFGQDSYDLSSLVRVIDTSKQQSFVSAYNMKS